MKECLKPEITESRFNPRRAPFPKFILTITLAVAFATPALAALQKDQSRLDQRHVAVPAERQWTSGNAQRRLDRQQGDDPYWTPCDDSSFGPNSCE
jgi:hypothetical protein